MTSLEDQAKTNHSTFRGKICEPDFYVPDYGVYVVGIVNAQQISMTRRKVSKIRLLPYESPLAVRLVEIERVIV